MTLQVFNLKKTSRKHKTNFLHLKDTDQTSQTGQSQRHKTNFSNISKTRNKHLKHLKLCNKGISRVLHDETDFLKCCNASKGHWSHTYCLHSQSLRSVSECQSVKYRETRQQANLPFTMMLHTDIRNIPMTSCTYLWSLRLPSVQFIRMIVASLISAPAIRVVY